MVFSYNWLQSFFKKKLPKPEKLAEILTMHSFEVSEVKKFGNDWILDIDVLPNRGSDCFSHLGIAREISAITGLKYTGPARAIKVKEVEKIKAKDFVAVEVKNREACPRYTARVILDVKIGPSPEWVEERLRACGLRPINNIVDITNYVMLETGQPLHAFDGEKIEGNKIIVRFAKKGEKIVTLDEEKYDLDENILVIADTQKPVAIAGIKGGKDTGIDSRTKIVVLESANFSPQAIRQASRLIGLKTDASWRFEHGIDPNLTEFAINRAAHLIKEIANGQILPDLIDFWPKKVFPKKIKLNLNYIEGLLGVKIPTKTIIKILKNLGFKPKAQQGHNQKGSSVLGRFLEVEVPTYRLDIFLPEDLVEEIGRIYGYQKISSIFPQVALIPPKRNLEIFWENNVKNILKELGFTEVYNYSFISEEDKEIFGNENLIEIKNPTSSDFRYLRPSLIFNLLKNLKKNQPNFSEIKIFELEKIFKKIGEKKRESNIVEKKMLTGLIFGGDFYLAKGIIDSLLNKMGISNIWYDQYQPTPEESPISLWHPKICAEIKIDGQELGFLGEISQKFLENLKINGRVTCFDIDFEKLAKLASEEQEFRPLSPYPAVVRDIAVLVSRNVKVQEILNIIESAGGKLIRDIDLFDIYEGEELPEGKKNLAFHIIYQAEDRALSSKEIEGLQKKIIEALEENPEWEVRR